MTAISDHSGLVTTIKTPDSRPPCKARATFRPHRVAQCFAHAHRASGLREAVPTATVHAPFIQHIHALDRVTADRVMSARRCRGSASATARRFTAQQLRKLRISIAHSGCVPAAGSHRGSHIWFAPSYANLVRTRPPACYQKSWLPGVGFHYGFQCFAVVSTESRLIKRTKSTIRTCHKVIKDQPTSLRISFTSDLVLVTVTSCMLPIGSKE